MTTKTMMMALAMAMGLAASASVIEVKFTVKTDVNGKVTTKTYKGVYDTKADKHAFYDTKAKKTIDGSYFGLVNKTTAGKKVGQNAELIWGDASNPENVLVAGAWGKDSSKSGHVAGIIDGKPATGTWTAKENTKKTYEELLKKYKITVQPTNKATSLIDDKTSAIASALNDLAAAKSEAAAELAAAKAKAAADLAAAEAKAAADLAAAEAKAAADVAAAEKKGADEKAAAEAKAAADLAAAQAQAAADLAKAEEKAADDLKAQKDDYEQKLKDAQDKYDEDMRTAAADLTATQNTLNDLVAALTEFDTPEMHEMFNEFLTEKDKAAKLLYTDATEEREAAEEALQAYEDSLDPSTLEKALDDANKAYDEAKKALEAATAKRDALDYTNMMLQAIYDKEDVPNGIVFMFTNEDESLGELGRIPKAQKAVDNEQAMYDAANNAGYDAAVLAAQENLTQKTTTLNRLDGLLKDAKEAMDAAEIVKNDAQDDVDNFEAPSYENGGLKSLDEWIADPTLNTNGYSIDSVDAHEAYVAYKTKVIDDAKKVVDDALAAATADYEGKKATYDSYNYLYGEAQKLVEAAQRTLDDLTGPNGKENFLQIFKDNLEKAKAKLEAEKAEYDYWLKEKSFTDEEKVKITEAYDAAKQEVITKSFALLDASQAVLDAKDDLANISTVQAEKLAELERVTSLTLHDDSGAAFAIETIKDKDHVGGYIEKRDGYQKQAIATGKAIREAIKIVVEQGGEFAKEINLEDWIPAEAEGDDAEGGEAEGGADAGDGEKVVL